MPDVSESPETFKVPSAPSTRRQSTNTSSPPKHRLSTATKRRAKSRSRGRPKPPSASRAANASLDPLRISTPTTVADAKPDAFDNDLKEILTELDAIEQRVTAVLQNLQKEMASCTNFMLDSILAGVASSIEEVKTKVPNVHKLRHANRLVKTQFDTLEFNPSQDNNDS